MGKIVLKFGVMAGLALSLMLLATIPFADRIGFNNGEYVGYASMVLSFLLVFFGVRSYRDEECGGAITFGRAFLAGLLITCITCVFYVVTWEVMYFKLMPGFMDKYAAYEVQKARASGATQAAVAEKLKQIDAARRLYDNPVYNASITFLEPLPVGIVITLITAAVLRRRKPGLAVAPA